MENFQRERRLTTTEGFLCGALAACIAVTASNPAEVVKTRLQLQGELAKDGGKKVYHGAIDALVKTWGNEGLRGVQRGLTPAYFYQFLVNGSRLGFYEPFRRNANKIIGRSSSEQIAFTSGFAGAISGVVGACLANPLFLVKARMQAYSPALPVGAQRYYRSSWQALSTIWNEERFRGLFRGVDVAALRTGMGSSVQLPSYNWTKSFIVGNGWGKPDSTLTFLASSAVSGICVCLVMQPSDTALTRMYNQPTERLSNGCSVGLLYKNPIDCLWKTFKAEGIVGWYKGTTAHFLRIAPHTIITLTANDIIINAYKSLW